MEYWWVFGFGAFIAWQWSQGAKAKRERGQTEFRQAIAKMKDVLQPFGDVYVDFATMTVRRDGFEYQLAAAYQGGRRWFVKLKQATNGDTRRSPEEYIRAAKSGRLDEEEAEREQVSLATWLREDSCRKKDDWPGLSYLEMLNDRIDDFKARAPQDLTALDQADSEVFRRAHTEWVLVPPKEEGWIDAKYENCRRFFADHPLHEPGITLDGILAEPRARNWKPPIHAQPEEITASWDTVTNAKKALVDCFVAKGRERRSAQSLVDDYASPWRAADHRL